MKFLTGMLVLLLFGGAVKFILLAVFAQGLEQVAYMFLAAWCLLAGVEAAVKEAK